MRWPIEKPPQAVHLVFCTINRLLLSGAWLCCRFALVLILASPFTSCDKGYIFVGDCFTDRPEEAEMEIRLTINDENRKVRIVIYAGTIESDSIIYTNTCQVETLHVQVPVDHYYTVVAQYKSGSKIINAVDGSKLRVVKTTQEDGSDCFQVQGDKLNVKLKY
jgi:hypothetical protein